MGRACLQRRTGCDHHLASSCSSPCKAVLRHTACKVDWLLCCFGSLPLPHGVRGASSCSLPVRIAKFECFLAVPPACKHVHQQAALPETRNPFVWSNWAPLCSGFPSMPAYHSHVQAMNLQVGCRSLFSNEAFIETKP